jgi:hypothetical protein
MHPLLHSNLSTSRGLICFKSFYTFRVLTKGVTLAQAYSIPYLEKVLNVKNHKVNNKLNNIVVEFHNKQEFESIHNMYLLPHDYIKTYGHYITFGFNSPFAHVPLLRYLKPPYFFWLDYKSTHIPVFEDIDWNTIYFSNTCIKLCGVNPIIIPQKYEQKFSVKKKNKAQKITPINFSIHAEKKEDIQKAASTEKYAPTDRAYARNVSTSTCVPIAKELQAKEESDFGIEDILVTVGIVGLAYISYKVYRYYAMQEKTIMHTFIDTNITEKNRLQYQIVYDLFPYNFPPVSKKILDNALPSPVSKEVTVSLPELKKCQIQIGILSNEVDNISSTKAWAGIVGLVGVPVSELISFVCNTGICCTIKKCCSWLYNKISSKNNVTTESVNNTVTSKA